jgi:hypothetical protein
VDGCFPVFTVFGNIDASKVERVLDEGAHLASSLRTDTLMSRLRVSADRAAEIQREVILTWLAKVARCKMGGGFAPARAPMSALLGLVAGGLPEGRRPGCTAGSRYGNIGGPVPSYVEQVCAHGRLRRPPRCFHTSGSQRVVATLLRREPGTGRFRRGHCDRVDECI